MHKLLAGLTLQISQIRAAEPDRPELMDDISWDAVTDGNSEINADQRVDKSFWQIYQRKPGARPRRMERFGRVPPTPKESKVRFANDDGARKPAPTDVFFPEPADPEEAADPADPAPVAPPSPKKSRLIVHFLELPDYVLDLPQPSELPTWTVAELKARIAQAFEVSGVPILPGNLVLKLGDAVLSEPDWNLWQYGVGSGDIFLMANWTDLSLFPLRLQKCTHIPGARKKRSCVYSISPANGSRDSPQQTPIRRREEQASRGGAGSQFGLRGRRECGERPIVDVDLYIVGLTIVDHRSTISPKTVYSE